MVARTRLKAAFSGSPKPQNYEEAAEMGGVQECGRALRRWRARMDAEDRQKELEQRAMVVRARQLAARDRRKLGSAFNHYNFITVRYPLQLLAVRQRTAQLRRERAA